jgi:DNA polymerase elongation subunit (family B)
MCDEEMAYMSKLKNYQCNFKEMKLASSALGENLLYFWDTPGLVHIDLMKDVQKTFNLPSYKLDYVASKFIRGEVSSYEYLGFNKVSLSCKSVNDIYEGDYIHLEVVKGFISDDVGEKYLVLSVNNKENKIIVKSDDWLLQELDTAKSGGVINWSQAKDDVGPKDIFRLFDGSPDDRAVVAKYCVKDCKLVNLLINKLEVVTKNIEMANVCYVPLSYLFIRGQGIKLFSLCLKEFKEQGYAFPVIKMDKWYRCLRPKCNTEYLNKWRCPKCDFEDREEMEIENNSYEGAIVFDPVPQVDYEALATKDYMSLYPASIMHKNMSHETMIENSDYDNLPGVTYFNAQFRESDGSIQYRRFAKLGDKLGVIPTILDKLLKTRKLIKKQMAIEKDYFKQKILDAKQLAVKITANSLYGQLGASTSPVCKRDIAACTTSTGREMLTLAKKYDEEILPWIMNGLKYMYEHNQLDQVEKLLDKELKARNDEEFIQDLKKYVTKSLSMVTIQPVVRYGDSVIGKTPLLLRKNNLICIKTINQLANSYKPMNRKNTLDNKEYADLSDYETWTETGWTKIERVIRHKLVSHKKLYRITTGSGFIVVTDDHSLLLADGTEISPKDINTDTKLLHSYPEHQISNDDKTMIFTNWCDAARYHYEYPNKQINFINNQIIITPKQNDNQINDIQEWTEEEEYVYDLTTENHHFQAGVGSLIVHNTDSIFSCYRFRENTRKINSSDALPIFKNIIAFARDLIEPFFGEEEQQVFVKVFNKYYNPDKVISMKLPESPITQPEPKHNAIILELEERIKQFIKEYMEESYFPWLWTISELVEKNFDNMYDIKLFNWAEHQLNKIRVPYNDLFEKRKQEIMGPLLEITNTIFNGSYKVPNQEIIEYWVDSILMNKGPSFNEIKLTKNELFKIAKNFMEKTVRDKWVNSFDKKELEKILTKLQEDIFKSSSKECFNEMTQMLIHYKNELGFYIKAGKNDILNPKLITNIMDLLEKYHNKIEKENNKLIEESIELWYKTNGKKSMEELLNDFAEKELGLKFDQYKINHINKIKNWINANMRTIDMTDMDAGDKYEYYWVQPRWSFNDDKIIHNVDIYVGGNSIQDKRTLDWSIEMGKLSGELIKSRLPFPHDCEYEKTFWPFGILTKKRYVGNKYEFDNNKYKLDFMGIVLKRRDNAPIVKEICGGIIDQLINYRSPEGAKNWTHSCLTKMFNGEYDIKYFLTSKTLKTTSSYKDWRKIAHVYLANKIAQRDPGNTPQSGDRIEYAVIKVKTEPGIKLLQGDMIETPKFIKENNLELDYLFYLTNQIMNPALQFLELVDKNACEIFNEFINKYSIKKEKPIKQPKPIKEKPIKQPKPIKEKPIKKSKHKAILLLELNKLVKEIEDNIKDNIFNI